MSLFGRSNGDLEWQLNKYFDGSGGNTTVFPCTSHEEAVEVARREILLKVDEMRSAEKWYGAPYMVASAKKIGMEIPSDLQERAREYAISEAQRYFDEAVKTFEMRREVLEKAKGEQ